MLSWFRKDPKKALEQEYAKKLEQARDLQRKGDIRGFADVTTEAEAILAKIDALPTEP